jgi:sec-independent protein translocase protein TatA
MMESILLWAMPGVPEMLIILVVILVIFGGKKLPGLMRGMGKGIKGFKDEMSDDPKNESKNNEKIEDDKA